MLPGTPSVPCAAVRDRRHRRSNALAALAVTSALAVGTACGSSRVVEQPAPAEPTTTTTTTAPAPRQLTQTATAVGAELEVFADWPGDPSSAPAAQAAAPAGVRPIPRPGLNSAGARKTDAGWVFSNPTYHGNPLTMVVTDNRGDWLKVMIPARPNGQQGWVRASDVTLGEHGFHGALTLSDFTLRVWNGEELIAESGSTSSTAGSR